MRGSEVSISVVKCSWVKCGEVLECSDEVSISVVKCSWVKRGEVLQYSDGLSNKVSDIIGLSRMRE